MWEILSVFACQTLFSLHTLHVPSLFQILVCVHEFSLVAAFSCFDSYNVLYSMCSYNVLYSMCHILIWVLFIIQSGGEQNKI